MINLFGLFLAIALIVFKYYAQSKSWLNIMGGPRWREHSNLLILLAVPAWGPWYVWCLYYVIFAIWPYLDDVYQERVQIIWLTRHLETGWFPPPPQELYYKSPLHRWGMRLLGR